MKKKNATRKCFSKYETKRYLTVYLTLVALNTYEKLTQR